MRVLLFLAILQLLAARLALAQDVRATVKADSVPVYASMSAESDVVSTLPRGKAVRITMSVTGGDGTWCSISAIDSAARLGYVRCDQLDRQIAPSTATSSGGTLSSAPTFANQSPSRAQERWAFAASAILASFNHEPLDTLATRDSVLGTKRLLQDAWGISNHDQLLQALQAIDQGGHRQLFSALGARTSQLSPDELTKVVSKLGSEDANSVMVAHRYYEKYSVQSIVAWDYARYINVCRWGVAAGYISEQEALPRIMHAAQILQQSFTSWSEFGENYLVGREFWSLRQTKIDGQAMRSIYRNLLSDPSSPWNRIPWKLPLQPSSSTNQNAPNLPPAAPSAKSSAAGSACEALQLAAAGGQDSDVESMLQSEPLLVNCRDSRGWTPLHQAAFNGQTKTIPLLVSHGATVNAVDKDGATPLHAAVTSVHPDTIEALLASGAQIDARDQHGNTPLQDAASAGNVDVAHLLLQRGANLESRDNEGFTPLNTAAWFDRTDAVELLLASRASVNTRSRDGGSPLYWAATSGSVEAVTLLLDHAALVNSGNAHGFTPLHAAASNDQARVAELLIAHGAEINARTDAGDTPLHWAALNGKINAATLLLQKGAQVSPSDKDGNTPLHWAAARGHVEMTELLIAHGANLNAKTRFGCTPLRGAYDAHQTATAQVLLRHQAPQ
jgi:ankyrin repeat protein